MNPLRPIPSSRKAGVGQWSVVGWFTRWLRRNPGPVTPPSLDMEVMWGKTWVPVRATGVAGLRLVVNRHDGQGSGAVGPGQAKDREQFMRVWTHLGGAPLVWADGTPVDDALI